LWEIGKGDRQASGTAAHLCVKENVAAGKLDASRLQAVLLSQGVKIDARYANR